MLLTLALCSLSVEGSGFLRDARFELRDAAHVSFEGRIQWPATITRTSFVVEGLGQDGVPLFALPVRARAESPVGRVKRSVRAHFELELPALEGVRELRLRLER